MKYLFSFLLVLFLSPHYSLAQDQKMSLETYNLWNKLTDPQISNDGNWVCYSLVQEGGDSKIVLHNTISGENTIFERAKKASFDHSNKLLSFLITASQETLDSLERNKVKKKDYPNDTLAMYHLENSIFDKISSVDSYKMPENFGSCIAFKLSPSKDTSKVKKENKDNGSRLMVYNFSIDRIHQFEFVKNYLWSEKNGKLLVHSTGQDSIRKDELHVLDLKNNSQHTLLRKKANFFNFNFNETGDKLSFVIDRDSLDESNSNYELCYFDYNTKALNYLADENADFLKEGWEISRYMKPIFSENNERLYFGICKNELVEDSLLLDSEKVDLDIWHYKDQILVPQQKKNLKRDKERSYTLMYDLNNNNFVNITSPVNSRTYVNERFKSDYFLSTDDQKYGKYTSWIGYAYKDVFLTNLITGETNLIIDSIQGSPQMSPGEKFIQWYSRPDTSYWVYNMAEQKSKSLTKSMFFDEISDTPQDPYNSGFAFWSDDDESMYIYDHYDLWKIDPITGKQTRLTEGRENKIRYRYISIDRELESLPEDTTILVSVFDEKDKTAGYAYLDLNTNGLKILDYGNFKYGRRPIKAKESDKVIFTKENFDTYPDLIFSDLSFQNQKRISNANPQQKDYAWGSIELFEWTDFEGEECDGLIAKPANFDPQKKYPLIVNFYEKSSHRLFEHRAPYPHRSTINYSYWTNKGYIIFNPDVRYKDGYPGESCYTAVMSGLEALIKEGYIDTLKMGLQGHSWGGYQIAHLITKTNVFACAEAGAPVVNMTSAYGGIRWGSGRSRMFQYEKTQSRIGATLWENPQLYLENSPLFNLPEVETPVLILHNDQDGAVPWYQGIEYFVGMRRLNKPAWLLNYNNEPHWPLKRQNRLDFNKRLEQFFDYYLMDKPIPEWMKKGVSVLESKTNNGLGY